MIAFVGIMLHVAWLGAATLTLGAVGWAMARDGFRVQGAVFGLLALLGFVWIGMAVR